MMVLVLISSGVENGLAVKDVCCVTSMKSLVSGLKHGTGIIYYGGVECSIGENILGQSIRILGFMLNQEK